LRACLGRPLLVEVHAKAAWSEHHIGKQQVLQLMRNPSVMEVAVPGLIILGFQLQLHLLNEQSVGDLASYHKPKGEELIWSEQFGASHSQRSCLMRGI
jgi:hypothetical protein